MSVDDTIRELSHTLAKLGELVMEINGQVGSISSRINITLQTFDDSISGIAKDANKMTTQVDTTIAQIPGSWAFYLLFFTMIAVLLLLSALLLINLLIKIKSFLRVSQIESSRTSTPTHPLVNSEYSSSKPFNPTTYSPSDPTKLRHIAVEMEHEPRRYGFGQSRGPSGCSSISASAFHQPSIPTEYFSNGNGICTPINCDLRGMDKSPRSHQGKPIKVHHLPKYTTTKKQKMRNIK
ncbi:hypothetical protein Mgra_00007441 [Meloidogyne graminicola]|uniref:Uncharacterized protein n=1 Tax=Meloidogyne graminicola TaxID=189291 RepID=A0A8S9ZIF3_9BILA|nr:hypothetical protein Mgra_00007441 [Meloidogyne graminicola]